MSETLILIGLVLNIVVTMSGFARLAMRFEHRLTALETHLVHLIPKRQRDRSDDDD